MPVPEAPLQHHERIDLLQGNHYFIQGGGTTKGATIYVRRKDITDATMTKDMQKRDKNFYAPAFYINKLLSPKIKSFELDGYLYVYTANGYAKMKSGTTGDQCQEVMWESFPVGMKMENFKEKMRTSIQRDASKILEEMQLPSSPSATERPTKWNQEFANTIGKKYNVPVEHLLLGKRLAVFTISYEYECIITPIGLYVLSGGTGSLTHKTLTHFDRDFIKAEDETSTDMVTRIEVVK